MGSSKRKDKHREKRSRSRERVKVKKERNRSRSDDSSPARHRKKRRERSSSSSNESFSSLKNLAKLNSSNNYNQLDNKPIEEYNQEYFFRMSKRIQEDLRDEFDKELFAQNLYQQIDGKEVGLSFHKTVSICIQWLIENATTPEEIKKLTEKFSIRKYTLEFVNNQFSSHVIQSIVEASLKVLSRECTLEPYEQKHYKWSLNYILDVAEFLNVHVDSILHDLNGFHVITTVMEALGGIRVGRLHQNRKSMGFGQKTNINVEIEKDIVIKEIPSQLKSALKRLSKSIVDREDSELRELMNGKATSILQYLLFILKLRANELCQNLVKKMIDLIFVNAEDKVVAISNSNCVYLVEALILVSSEHRLNKIWLKYFKGNLRRMWENGVANFVVQRLIDAIESEDLYQEISFEVLPHLASIFLLNRPGIGVCLAKATLKFPKFQQEFIYAVMKSFRCYEPKEKQVQLVPLMLFNDNTIASQNHHSNHSSSKTNHHHSKQSNQISLHGSLMLQYMFQYEEPYKLCKSLLSLDSRDLVGICNDASGSHAIDAFLVSTSVPEKTRIQFIDTLSGYFVNLACNKYGSRVIDNILNSVSIKVKHKIMDEFCSKEQALQNNKNGYFLSKNVGLYHYKYRYEEWKEQEEAKERKRKTFSDLVSPDHKSSYDNGHHRNSNYDQQSSNSSHHSSYGNSRGNQSFKRPSHHRSSPYKSKY